MNAVADSAPPPSPRAEVGRALRCAAGALESISLEALGAAALMDRVDTKFVLPARLAAEALLPCGSEYRALDVAGTRFSRYETRYYDTPDLAFYRAHHAGRATRHKVRRRSYVDSDAHYLEVKKRANDGRTRKARIRVGGGGALDLRLLAHDPLATLAPELATSLLVPAADVAYTRLTLVRRDGTERVTLDVCLAFAAGGRALDLAGVVIAEVKQARRVRSPFVDAIRALGVREGAISKYCLAIAALDPTAKINRFKPQLRHVLETAAGRRRP